MSETKKCAQCGQEKPVEDFSKLYKNLCKACVAENVKAKRHNPTVYYGRGISIPIPEDAAFISPMRFQAAIAAMHGLLASGSYTTNSADFIAQRSVIYADALLNELSRDNNEHA